MSNDLEEAIDQFTDAAGEASGGWHIAMARGFAAYMRHLRSHPAPPPSPSEENGGEASDEGDEPWDARARAREDSRRAGPVTHDEARNIAQGYIDKAFGNKEDPKTRITHSIPADYKRDSDLRLHAYIDQQEEQASSDAATIAGLRRVVDAAVEAAAFFKRVRGDELSGVVSLTAYESKLVAAVDALPASLRPQPGGGK